MSLKKVLASVAVASFVIGMIGCSNNPATVSTNYQQQPATEALYTATNTATDIANGGNGNWPWIIGATAEAGGYGIYYWNNPSYSFVKVPGGAVNIDQGKTYNSIWVANSSNDIYCRVNLASGLSSPVWARLQAGTTPIKGIDVAIPTGLIGSSSLAFVGSDGAAYYYFETYPYYSVYSGTMESGWAVKFYAPGSGRPIAKRIASGYSALTNWNMVYIVDANGQIWSCNSNTATPSVSKCNISILAKDIAAADGEHIAIVGTDNNVYLCKTTNGTTWTTVKQTAFSNVNRVSIDKVSFASGIWVVTNDKRVVNAPAQGW